MSYDFNDKTPSLERIDALLVEIEDDMERDVIRDDGLPFNGETVSRSLGEIRAAVAALAMSHRALVLHLQGGPPEG